MITKSQYNVLSKYKDMLESWSRGHQVTVTRIAYNDIKPILQAHGYNVGSLTCSYCALQLCKHAYDEYSAYKKKYFKNDKSKKEESHD